MSTVARIAVVLFGVLLFAAVGTALAPETESGYECGTWVLPEWQEDEVRAFADDAGDLGATGRDLGTSAVTAYRLCDDALDDRRNLTLGLLAAAVVLPTGVAFVGASRR